MFLLLLLFFTEFTEKMSTFFQTHITFFFILTKRRHFEERSERTDTSENLPVGCDLEKYL